jgi:hypothetical protein
MLNRIMPYLLFVLGIARRQAIPPYFESPYAAPPRMRTRVSLLSPNSDMSPLYSSA